MLRSFIYWRLRKNPWLGRAALKAIPDLKWRIRIDPIGSMGIRLRQHRMFWLHPPLIFEGFMLGALQRLAPEGSVFYDIGANIGLYSRFMAQCFKASRVYAFEPIPANRTMLAENLALGGCASTVEIVPSAVGNEDGECEFQVDDLTSNSGTLDAVAHGKASQSRLQYGLPPATIKVNVVRLDTLLGANRFPPPNMIKLDVEGAEALVLEGARKLLLEHGPNLAIELHGAEAARDVLQILWRVGYHCFGYLKNGENYNYQEVTPTDMEHVKEKYSLHFLAASRDPALLRRPIEDFRPEK